MPKYRSTPGRARPARRERRHERQRRFVRLCGYWACLIVLGAVIGLAIHSWREPTTSMPPPLTLTSRPIGTSPTAPTTLVTPPPTANAGSAAQIESTIQNREVADSQP